MAKKYRKLPVVVEAMQFHGGWKSAKEIIDWASENTVGMPKICFISTLDVLKIRTLEGEMKAERGCYVIRGVKGEFYPCNQDIFKRTYEAVAEVETLEEEVERLR